MTLLSQTARYLRPCTSLTNDRDRFKELVTQHLAGSLSLDSLLRFRQLDRRPTPARYAEAWQLVHKLRSSRKDRIAKLRHKFVRSAVVPEWSLKLRLQVPHGLEMIGTHYGGNLVWQDEDSEDLYQPIGGDFDDPELYTDAHLRFLLRTDLLQELKATSEQVIEIKQLIRELLKRFRVETVLEQSDGVEQISDSFRQSLAMVEDHLSEVQQQRYRQILFQHYLLVRSQPQMAFRVYDEEAQCDGMNSFRINAHLGIARHYANAVVRLRDGQALLKLLRGGRPADPLTGKIVVPPSRHMAGRYVASRMKQFPEYEPAIRLLALREVGLAEADEKESKNPRRKHVE